MRERSARGAGFERERTRRRASEERKAQESPTLLEPGSATVAADQPGTVATAAVVAILGSLRGLR